MTVKFKVLAYITIFNKMQMYQNLSESINDDRSLPLINYAIFVTF